MDNNYKEIRERTSEKLGYVVHRESSRPFLCLENEIERKRQREKKEKERIIVVIIRSISFKLRSLRFDVEQRWAFFFFDPSPADGGRWEAVSMFTREIVRVVLSCGGGGGRIRGLPMRCWRHHRSCGSSHDRCSYEGKENGFFNTTSLNFHHKSVHNPTLFNIQSHNILITSFEALLRPCITYSAWMRFIITRSLNTNQINPY